MALLTLSVCASDDTVRCSVVGLSINVREFYHQLGICSASQRSKGVVKCNGV